MAKQVRQTVGKGCLGSTGILLALVLFYLLAALLLGFIPVNRSYAQPQQAQAIEIFVTSNGVHTDLVLPVVTAQHDWREHLPLHQYPGANDRYSYLAFGWGDRRFYMETPEWKDLKPQVALSAMLWPTRTAMHVKYVAARLEPTKHQRPILLAPEQYQVLVNYIASTFQRDESGQFMLIEGAGYTSRDNFYEAHGRFYFLQNCNNWVNLGLKQAGVKAAVWAPLPFAVMRHHR